MKELDQISFLPEPPLKVVFPSPGSLDEECLTMLLNGESFNHPYFEKKVGSWRLAANIERLKKMGWPIAWYDVGSPSESCSHRRVRYYLLPASVIAKVKEIQSGTQ